MARGKFTRTGIVPRIIRSESEIFFQRMEILGYCSAASRNPDSWTFSSSLYKSSHTIAE